MERDFSFPVENLTWMPNMQDYLEDLLDDVTEVDDEFSEDYSEL